MQAAGSTFHVHEVNRVSVRQRLSASLLGRKP